MVPPRPSVTKGKEPQVMSRVKEEVPAIRATAPAIAASGDLRAAAQGVAADVLAAASHNPRHRVLTSEQKEAFTLAAPFALSSRRALENVVRTAGKCSGYDLEQWYPDYREDPAVRSADRSDERAVAARLCGGCPVRGQCLALDYAQAEGKVQHLWGIWGGLGARDRRQMLALWLKLQELLALWLELQEQLMAEATAVAS
jgi:hypothetical protein